MEPEKVFATVQYWVSAYAVRIIVAILIFIVGKWISRRLASLTARMLKKQDVDITLINFLDGLVYYSLLVMVIIAAAAQLGINTTSFLTIVGAAGLAVGLALKDSLSNFASGVMLILFRPFKVGDYVSAAGVSGSVQSISLFNTVMHTPDNQKIIVPNSSITGSVITNVTANPTRRIDLVVGIGYEDDIDKARAVLERILSEEKRILADPAPTIAVSELADSSVNFVFRPWVNAGDYWPVRFALTERIKKEFDREGVSIPYPQQDVHLFMEKQEAVAVR